MELVNYRITLDTLKNGVQKTLQGFNTGDAYARRIEISLVKGSELYPLTENIVASMYVQHESASQPSINACEVVGNKVIYNILPTDISTEGTVSMQLKIIEVRDSISKILVAPKFELLIWESIGIGSATSTATFTALETALAEAKTYSDKAIESVSLDDDYLFIVTYADGTEYISDAIQTAMSEISSVEEFVERAETAATSAETAKSGAESAKASAETAATSASASKQYIIDHREELMGSPGVIRRTTEPTATADRVPIWINPSGQFVPISTGGGAEIDDDETSNSKTWSSGKIYNELNGKLTSDQMATINGQSITDGGNIVISGGGGSGDGDVTTKILIDTLAANRHKDFTFRDMPKAQFVLILDDCLPAVVSLCVTNALAKNVPLCMSAISSYFNDMCTKGQTNKTVLEEIKRGIANGGEVLLHGNGTINASNIDDESVLKAKFLTEKELFITNGLNPRGAITIGGGNEIYQDARTDRWVRALFDYSDGWGLAEPYYHRRNAPTTLEAAKSIIDNAIANKSFCPIFAHKWYDFWNDMIDYAIAQGGVWTTYANVYDTYGTTKSVKALETRIKALEAGGGGTPTLTSITASKTTTSYSVGDTLSTSDITVLANYSDETSSNVTSSATIDTSAVVMGTEGTYNISVSYNGQSTTIAITVSAVEPTPSTGTVIYQVASISGTCNGTADQKVGSSSTSWTSGKQYKYEFDYEVTAVADSSTSISIRDVNSSDLTVNLTNATVGQTGHCEKTVSNSTTRTRQAFLFKNVNSKSYTVNLTNVVITEL